MRKFIAVIATVACLEFLVAGVIAAPNFTETHLAKSKTASIRPESKSLTSGGSEKTPANPDVEVSSAASRLTGFDLCSSVGEWYICSP